ncbi:hypothetical protein A2U01_0054774, partial [Trifolium medium]|nr:hypothetical protein [Trifolium medium]
MMSKNWKDVTEAVIHGGGTVRVGNDILSPLEEDKDDTYRKRSIAVRRDM